MVLLAGGCLALLIVEGCKNAEEAPVAPTCAPVPPPSCVLYDGGGDAPFIPCVSDQCSLATLEAIIATELNAASAGAASASNPAVVAVAQHMASDFQSQQSNLATLEAQLGVSGVACTESVRLAADLAADLAATSGLTGPAFDDAFCTSQVAALGEIKQTINLDLIGCAGNGNLKTTLRFVRLRTPDGGTSVADGGLALGVVPDLAALQALLPEGGTDASGP